MKNKTIIKEYPWIFSSQYSKKIQDEFIEWYNRVNKFNDEFIHPNALALDKKMHLDHDTIPQDILEAACDYELFSCWMPKLAGGKDIHIVTLTMLMEQVAKACLGLANLIFAPGLALSALISGSSSDYFMPLIKELVKAEKKRKPIIYALAITEASGGSDLQNMDRLQYSTSSSKCQKVSGGYKLSGTKVFISDAAPCDYIVSIFWEDSKNRKDTTRMFLVPVETEGLIIGKNENKMGVKACSANEVIYDECFLSDSMLLNTSGISTEIANEIILGTTRTGVGAMATGTSRSALSIAVDYAQKMTYQNQAFIEQDWVKHKLAKMWRNIQMARTLLYSSAQIQNDFGLFAALYGNNNMTDYLPMLPEFITDNFLYEDLMLKSPILSEYLKNNMKNYTKEQAEISADIASNIKVTGTDLAFENISLAMDICSSESIRHDFGLEKIYRDIKLLMIYEGSNQICDREIFDMAIKLNKKGE